MRPDPAGSSPSRLPKVSPPIDLPGATLSRFPFEESQPSACAYHAGFSILNGREGCNYCTVGIEFQGNTLEAPLTQDQIASGIEYLLPIMAEYKIPLENVVTHEMVRTAYKEKYPNRRCSGKVDITPEEYQRFMQALKPEWEAYLDSCR